MIIAPTLAAPFETSDAANTSPVNHADGVPCPDGGDEGPCDGGCPCICCPGHATVIFTPSVASLEAPHLSSLHRFGPAETVHPSGIHLRGSEDLTNPRSGSRSPQTGSLLIHDPSRWELPDGFRRKEDSK
jgi:hypothetical protein